MAHRDPRIAPRVPAAEPAAAQVFTDDLDALPLAIDDEHHLSKVLRLRDGEKVIASDGRGSWRLSSYRRSSALEPEGPLRLEPAQQPAVTVGFVPPKGDRPEWVVQKLTELGVDRIAFVRSVRAVVHWEAERATRALARLERVAREAAAQSRRVWLPELVGPMTLEQLAQLVAPGDLALAQPGGGPPRRSTTAVVVGPEGGWDEDELDGGNPLVGLGGGVLRAETAAVVAGSLLCALREGTVAEANHQGVRDGNACNHHAE